jgi:NAD(P)H-hydrate repair Nnr-like enzyme with NAD(P)H-hydrate epimerase domain
VSSTVPLFTAKAGQRWFAVAGLAIAAIVTRYRDAGPVVAFAGNGNNGGDAFAALAELEGVRVAYHDPSHDGSATRVDARERARASGVELRPYPADAAYLRTACLLLDGLCGVNVRLPLDATVAERVAALNAAGVPILALDIATGTDPTTGALNEPHVRAVATIAIGRPKLGSMLDPGRGATRDLWCAPLGMRDDDLPNTETDAFVYDIGRLCFASAGAWRDGGQAQLRCSARHRGFGGISRSRDPLRARRSARRRRICYRRRAARCRGHGARARDRAGGHPVRRYERGRGDSRRSPKGRSIATRSRSDPGLRSRKRSARSSATS